MVELMTDEEARAHAKETGQSEPTEVHVKRGISAQVGEEKTRMQLKRQPETSLTVAVHAPSLAFFCAQLDAMRDTHAALVDILAERSEADRVELASLALGNPSPSPSQRPAQAQAQGFPASPASPTDSFFMPQDLLSHYQLVYLPQLGFLAKLPLRPGVTDAATMIPNFEFKFRTEAEVFYKNQTTDEMDEGKRTCTGKRRSKQ